MTVPRSALMTYAMGWESEAQGHVHLRTGPRSQDSELRAAVAGILPGARSSRVWAAYRGDPWRASLYVCTVLRACTTVGIGTGAGRRGARRYGGDHGAEHPRDAGGALRGADAGGGAVFHQYPARCRGGR